MSGIERATMPPKRLPRAPNGARRLLSSVLPELGWQRQQVELVAHSGELRPAVVDRVGQTSGGSEIALATALELLEDGRRYSVLADVY